MGKISIAGVLRLRAIKPSVCRRSARRSAQDDGFVRGLEIQLVGYAENTKKIEKVTGSERCAQDDVFLRRDIPRLRISDALPESRRISGRFQSSLRDFSMGMPTQDCVLG